MVSPGLRRPAPGSDPRRGGEFTGTSAKSSRQAATAGRTTPVVQVVRHRYHCIPGESAACFPGMPAGGKHAPVVIPVFLDDPNTNAGAW
jgi:hypothetical protein